VKNLRVSQYKYIHKFAVDLLQDIDKLKKELKIKFLSIDLMGEIQQTIRKFLKSNKEWINEYPDSPAQIVVSGSISNLALYMRLLCLENDRNEVWNYVYFALRIEMSVGIFF
jgi:hypothetical protein